eukprot:scaffold288270_cov24-Tisochrysis_lutea.AAC.1
MLLLPEEYKNGIELVRAALDPADLQAGQLQNQLQTALNHNAQLRRDMLRETAMFHATERDALLLNWVYSVIRTRDVTFETELTNGRHKLFTRLMEDFIRNPEVFGAHIQERRAAFEQNQYTIHEYSSDTVTGIHEISKIMADWK